MLGKSVGLMNSASILNCRCQSTVLSRKRSSTERERHARTETINIDNGHSTICTYQQTDTKCCYRRFAARILHARELGGLEYREPHILADYRKIISEVPD